MNKKTLCAILIAAVILAALVLLIRVVSGAFTLLGSAVNAVIAIVVILALVIIVGWMFWYARRH